MNGCHVVTAILIAETACMDKRRNVFPGRQYAFLLILLAAFFVSRGGAFHAPIVVDKIMPSSVILDRNGRVLYEVLDPDGQKARPVQLKAVPLACQQAIIATEDHRFYYHPGVDLLASARALWQYFRYHRIVSGASTITQQTARLLYMTPAQRRDRTLGRKLWEMWLAYRLHQTHSKDDVLMLYLNHVYFGNFAVGIGAAAHAYFATDVRSLDVAQCALLAGLPQNPALYNPLTNLPAARARQREVLHLMVKQGYLTASAAEQAAREPLTFAAPNFPIRAPHFVMLVQQLLERELGVERVRAGGLRVETTLDLGWQERAVAVVRRQLRELQDTPRAPVSRKVNDAALLALDPHSGAILAWVGSPDYFDREHAGAVNAVLSLRQPGSALKPITYAAAFDPNLPEPYTPATVLLDLPTIFFDSAGKPYEPLNYDRRWHGPTSLRTALACSYNSLAVKVLEHAGIGRFLRLAERLGLTHLSQSEANLSLTLGGAEETLLDITAAYGAFANGGHYVVPIAIRRVTDAQGNILLENVPVRAEDAHRRAGVQVLDSRVAFLVTSILSDDLARAPSFGRFSALYLHGRPAAAKTGTTTDWRDNWTIGYTPNLVTGVWVGNADNEPMRGISGISGAAPIWHNFMTLATRGTPVRAFPRPAGVLQRSICADSGLLPTPLCPHRRLEWFIAGTVPTRPDDQYRRIGIDTRTGLRATATTPQRYVRWQVFRVLPAEATDWAEQNDIPQPPLPATTGSRAAAPLLLMAPDPGAVFRLSPGLSAQEQQIALRAAENVALRRLTFYVDGRPWRTLTKPPWTAWWPLQAGKHTFFARGEGEGGQQYRTETVRITVKKDDE